ncbi:hypothetical protein JFT33_05885 [Pseudomonas carnis]|uniref:hypothetical protein n=1 Tax=Pseudomonas carnis TaxID=2487355 RepID=UPI0018E76089|nr:hypothetical protein [Pseudomonas carnis]MBJ2206113.1 hypothetical protein [Pseudomonas carnis]MBY8953872.1 hypothetical protein [Pseudomonas carnis]
MSEARTADQRISELEAVLKTVIVFNQNAMAAVSRRVTEGNPGITDALIQDLRSLKELGYNGIDKGLYDSYIDSFIVAVNS